MTTEAQDQDMELSAEAGPRPRQRRNRSERTIQDSVVVIGSLLMYMSFGLMLELNLRDYRPGDGDVGKSITVGVTFFLLCALSTFFGYYIYRRLRKNCRREETETDENNEEDTDLPPPYEHPPPYESIDKKIVDQHTIVHM